jgi:membrane protein
MQDLESLGNRLIHSLGRPAYGARRAHGLSAPIMRSTLKFAWDTANRFLAHDGWAIASHIALSTLTSLFPFLIVVTALAGFFGSEELAQETAKLMFLAWPREVADPIANEVSRVLTERNHGLLTLGTLAAFYFASSGVESMRLGLNRAYGGIETRPWYILRAARSFGASSCAMCRRSSRSPGK